MHQLIMGCFGGTPLVILIDLLNGLAGVERVAIFLTVGDLSGTLDGVSGRYAIVEIGRFIPIYSWCILKGVIFFHFGAGKHLFFLAFCCIQTWFDVKLYSSEFLVGIFHPTPV